MRYPQVLCTHLRLQGGIIVVSPVLMHSIRTLKAVEYKGCKVYIRNFDTTFEYLAVIRGELYTMHMTVLRGWKERVLGRDYTEAQLTNVTKYLMVAAETTIDTVLGEKKAKK